MTPANILLIIVLILLNGFFVGVEFAAVSGRRVRLELLPGANSSSGKIARNWFEQPAVRDRLIAATQLGITLTSLALGAVGENTFEAWLEPFFASLHFVPELAFLEHILVFLPLLLSLIIVTSLHVVFGEQVPKVAVLRAPERFALASAPIMDLFNRVFKSFIDLLDWATRLVLRILGLPDSAGHHSIYSAEEFKQMVTGPEAEGVIQDPEREMLSAVIEFGELVVRQVAKPRFEIVAVQAKMPILEVMRIASEESVTKLPVYEDSLEQIVGIVHVLDLLKALQEGRQAQSITARELAREALFVPETISVNDLLHQFRSRRTHMAIVLDEFGGTYGLVTLQDLLDEIVGEVQDAFNAEPPNIQAQPDGSALIEGTTLIEEINEHFGLALHDPYYDTIAGYILGKLGNIPQEGEVVEDKAHNIRLSVERMEGLRIAGVRLVRL